MIKRFISEKCFSRDFGRQMRFVTGPRQCGKTTLAREHLTHTHCSDLYFNWDKREVRSLFRQDHYFYRKAAGAPKPFSWVCFDEIHKMPKWKNILKDFFDSDEKKYRFIVTGSARMDLLRKTGDSLAGRYFTFRLFPLSLAEIAGGGPARSFPEKEAARFLEKKLASSPRSAGTMSDLLALSGFPEPFLSGSAAFSTKWRSGYLDLLVREDLRDLTHIAELENLSALMFLLPSKIASPLSLNSLREDLEVSYNAVKSYLKALELGYVVFSLPAYSKRVARSVKKERKFYFYDWTRPETEAGRFENYTAVELKILVSLWEDLGLGHYELYYVRTRDGFETDFLITRDTIPYILFEAKLSDSPLPAHNKKHAKLLGDIPLVLLTRQEGIASVKEGGYHISASRFFA